MSIREKAHGMNLSRKVVQRGSRFTPKQDEIIKRYCDGEISREEVIALTERDIDSIKGRIYTLGLLPVKEELNWEWINNGGLTERDGSSRQ